MKLRKKQQRKKETARLEMDFRMPFCFLRKVEILILGTYMVSHAGGELHIGVILFYLYGV